MRVHELAKELGVASKEIVSKIKGQGGKVGNHMSQLDETWVGKMRSAFPQTATKTKAASTSPAKSSKSGASTTKEKKATLKKSKTSADQVKKEELPAQKIAEPQTIEVETEVPTPEPEVPPVSEPELPTIVVRFPTTVGKLAELTKKSIPALIKTLMEMGIFANVNQFLNQEVAMSLGELLGVRFEKMEDETDKILSGESDSEDEGQLEPRPPVVTMMGHVDHGKTSLLDAIRNTNVAAKEKGAITQHIGAYGVDIEGKGHVTFLDTPGHEAFTAMRARGANVTDVVVLVVAADDGVMPQTIEAIDHAKEANCPIVVAINKVDLPSADPQRVMKELQKYDLISEEWGGKTICAKVSAKSGEGIDHLLDMLLLESEVLELKANAKRDAFGVVIEGHLSKNSGSIATVIVQKGTLKLGDLIVCGENCGRVRAMKNDHGKNVQEVGPSYAATVTGLSGVPDAGDNFYVVKDEKTARRITEKKALEKREVELTGASKHLSLENLYEKLSEGNFKELKIIIKADVQGSMEALSQSLEKLSNDQCQVRVIHRGVGGINESDVMLAAASDAVILGFHVKADTKAESAAEQEGVSLRYYHIIYEAVEDVRKAMEGLLEPTYNEVVDGKVEIRQVFQSSRVGTIGGGYVLKGKVLRANYGRVIRDSVVLFEGKLGSLKRFKDDVRDVAQGYECGIALEGFNELKIGDIVESYRMEKTQTKLV